MGSSIYIGDFFLCMLFIALIYIGYSYFNKNVEDDAFSFGRIVIISCVIYKLISLNGFIEILYWNQGIGKLMLSFLIAVVTELLLFKMDG